MNIQWWGIHKHYNEDRQGPYWSFAEAQLQLSYRYNGQDYVIVPVVT